MFDLFKLSISSWFNFVGLCVSRNLSISSGLSISAIFVVTSPFSLLILFGFSLFCTWWAWPEVCQFSLFFQKTSSWFYWFFSSFKKIFISSLIFIIASFCWFFFLSFFFCLILLSSRLGCLKFFLSLEKSLYHYKLPSKNAFSAAYRCCICVFSLSFASRYFYISSLILSLVPFFFFFKVGCCLVSM